MYCGWSFILSWVPLDIIYVGQIGETFGETFIYKRDIRISFIVSLCHGKYKRNGLKYKYICMWALLKSWMIWRNLCESPWDMGAERCQSFHTASRDVDQGKLAFCVRTFRARVVFALPACIHCTLQPSPGLCGNDLYFSHLATVMIPDPSGVQTVWPATRLVIHSLIHSDTLVFFCNYIEG